MDLPTYTSIWRIEKRLYKLYDFRLPMPLPIGQITVFAAIAVPYVVLLTLLGVPFNHTLIWLYVLPPGVVTWLVTRPVLEGKRLPELVHSQLRYLAEPRVWCRMLPLAESDVIVVTGRVWHLPASVRAQLADRTAQPRRVRAHVRLPARGGSRVPSRAATVRHQAAQVPTAQSVPAQLVPAQSVPAQSVPAQQALGQSVPGQRVPGLGTAVVRQPVQAGAGPVAAQSGQPLPQYLQAGPPGRAMRSPTAPPTRSVQAGRAADATDAVHASAASRRAASRPTAGR